MVEATTPDTTSETSDTAEITLDTPYEDVKSVSQKQQYADAVRAAIEDEKRKQAEAIQSAQDSVEEAQLDEEVARLLVSLAEEQARTAHLEDKTSTDALLSSVHERTSQHITNIQTGVGPVDTNAVTENAPAEIQATDSQGTESVQDSSTTPTSDPEEDTKKHSLFSWGNDDNDTK